MNESSIEREVMRRVYRIAILRILISGVIFALALTGLALYGIGREVWVAMVFENGPAGFFPHLGYLLYAFFHTRLIVQALVVIALAAALYLAREFARLLALLIAPDRLT